MIRNTVWAFAGNAGYAVCQWGVLIVIARLAGAADLGHFAFALALSAPIVITTNLQLRALQATDARREYPFGAYLGLRLAGIAIALGISTVVATGLGYGGRALVLILAVAVAKGIEALSDVVFGLLQQAEDLRRVALSLLARGVVSVAAMGFVLGTGGEIVMATVMMTAGWGAVFVLHDLPAAARLAPVRPIFTTHVLARLAWLALPMGCVSGLVSLTADVPRYAIQASLGPEALGQFAALAYLVVAATQPVLALGAASSPRLARHFVSDVVTYRRMARRLTMIAAGLGAVLVAATVWGGPAFLTAVYGRDHAGQITLLTWLAVAAGAGFIASAFGYAATAARRFPEQLAIAMVTLAVCAGASHVLVPRFGLVGAAWALLGAEIVRIAGLLALHGAVTSTRSAPTLEPAVLHGR